MSVYTVNVLIIWVYTVSECKMSNLIWFYTVNVLIIILCFICVSSLVLCQSNACRCTDDLSGSTPFVNVLIIISSGSTLTYCSSMYWLLSHLFRFCLSMYWLLSHLFLYCCQCIDYYLICFCIVVNVLIIISSVSVLMSMYWLLSHLFLY